jgi:hypothetical protein
MIYLIETPSGRKAYYSFRRLLQEENIEDICKKSGDKVPARNTLPVRIAFNQITIMIVELDERL